MYLHTATPPNKAENFLRPASQDLGSKSHVCRFIMARYDVSASLASTIAALALLGGAK